MGRGNGYYLCTENIGADQLFSYCNLSAPLLLHNAKVWFSHDTAQIIMIKSALMFVERLEINWVAQLPK